MTLDLDKPSCKSEHSLSGGKFVSAKMASDQAAKCRAGEQVKVDKFIKDFNFKLNQVR